MTVAVLAERHRRATNTVVLTVLLTAFVAAGGWFVARSVQNDLADSVVSQLGRTSSRIEVVVDGRDVTLRSSAVIADDVLSSVRAIAGVGT